MAITYDVRDPAESLVIGQQVADLLRDRLHSVGGELADSKSRITELEIAQGEDRTALSEANATILSTSE